MYWELAGWQLSVRADEEQKEEQGGKALTFGGAR